MDAAGTLAEMDFWMYVHTAERTAAANRAQPCPFCGSEDVQYTGNTKDGWVYCNAGNCGACGPTKTTREEAVAAWNAAPRR